ncbi:MAG: acetyl-CoA carboxylase carboxyltransferase subunit beta [Alphaproteobacteria bacterium]|nr:MAG: acetyl-CoA carboxylase carboxyltransferase subunit beta [Alphaproteobacteria bacterium]
MSNWLTNLVRPRIQALVSKREVPDNLWEKCPGCATMLFHRELADNARVCRHCGHHLRLPVLQRLQMLFDEGRYALIDVPQVTADPLRFRDQKRYIDRIKESRARTGRNDAILVAQGLIDGQGVVVAAFDFSFMGGSMGMAVGEGILTAAGKAVANRMSLLLIPASGGARMQEGALSLMQMPRTVIAVQMVKEAGLPVVVLFTDPTTGGVSASFAMLGDIHISEPGAQIGFAGARVIESTIRETLPQGFQRAEYLLEHGMVDMVVPRHELKQRLGYLFSLLRSRKSGRNLPAILPLPGNGKNAHGSAKRAAR